MAINKKLIHFQTLNNFNIQLSAGNILDTSICFIKDAKKIWTHGQFYDCDIDLSDYATKEELNNKQDKLISGVTIKTIDDESILGSGNIALPELNAQYDETNQRLILQDVRDNTSLIEDSKKAALRELYIAAGALYNNTSADITRTAPWGETVIHKAGHYYLNGLGDITEKEMLAIYDTGKYWISDNAAGFGSQKARTNLPPLSYVDYYYKTYDFTQVFNNAAVEVVMLNDIDYMPPSSVAVVKVNAINYFGQGAVKLKRVIGTIDVGKFPYNAVVNAPNIEYVSIKNLKHSLRTNSALLSKESVLYVIQNATPTSAITITLNADAYARLAEDVDIVAALEAQPLVTLVSA